MSFILGQICSALFTPAEDAPSLSIRSSDVDVPRKKATPQQIFDAVRSNDVSCVDALYNECTIDLDVFDESNGNTPLHQAVIQKNIKIVNKLLTHAEDNPRILNAIDWKGWTPLMHAANLTHPLSELSVKMIVLLLNAGANADVDHMYHKKDQNEKETNPKTFETYQTLLVKTLAEAKCDLTEASIISAKNKNYAVTISCLDSGANLLKFLREYLKLSDIFLSDDTISDYLKISLEKHIDKNIITSDEFAHLIDDALLLGSEHKATQLFKICVNSTSAYTRAIFPENIIINYALNEQITAVSTLLPALGAQREDRARNVLLNIARRKEIPEIKRISAMKIITTLTKTHRKDFSYKSLLSTTDLDTLRILAAAGFRIPEAQILNPIKLAILNNDTNKTKVLINLGLNQNNVFEINDKADANSSTNLSKIALDLFIFNNGEFTDEKAKQREVERWIISSETILKAAKSLILDKAKEHRFDHAQTLMGANVPSGNSLANLAREDKLNEAMKIIDIGGDVSTALSEMDGNIETYNKTGKAEAAQATQKAKEALVQAEQVKQNALSLVEQAEQAAQVAQEVLQVAQQNEQDARDALENAGPDEREAALQHVRNTEEVTHTSEDNVDRANRGIQRAQVEANHATTARNNKQVDFDHAEAEEKTAAKAAEKEERAKKMLGLAVALQGRAWLAEFQRNQVLHGLQPNNS